MPKTYAEIQALSATERYQLASESYKHLREEDPALGSSPGDMANRIRHETGLDFATAVAVALSAAR